MAYVSKELAAKVRKQLKETFGKEYKFSVRKDGGAMDLTLVSSPFTFKLREGSEDANYRQLNHCYIERDELLTDEQKEFFAKVVEIAMEGNFDKSDSMTDYFHVGWYLHLSIGKWDKPHIETGTKKEKVPSNENHLLEALKEIAKAGYPAEANSGPAVYRKLQGIAMEAIKKEETLQEIFKSDYQNILA